MRKLVKIILILALLSWAAMGLRHAQGKRDDGVWRQDIPLDSSARLEIFDVGDETASLPSRIKWLASQAVTWAKDSEIEE
jgi:hypothetical protein